MSGASSTERISAQVDGVEEGGAGRSAVAPAPQAASTDAMASHGGRAAAE